MTRFQMLLAAYVAGLGVVTAEFLFGAGCPNARVWLFGIVRGAATKREAVAIWQAAGSPVLIAPEGRAYPARTFADVESMLTRPERDLALAAARAWEARY